MIKKAYEFPEIKVFGIQKTDVLSASDTMEGVDIYVDDYVS